MERHIPYLRIKTLNVVTMSKSSMDLNSLNHISACFFNLLVLEGEREKCWFIVPLNHAFIG